MTDVGAAPGPWTLGSAARLDLQVKLAERVGSMYLLKCHCDSGDLASSPLLGVSQPLAEGSYEMSRLHCWNPLVSNDIRPDLGRLSAQSPQSGRLRHTYQRKDANGRDGALL